MTGCFCSAGGGGGGGGGGLSGNPGNPGNPGNSASPVTYNCVSVTSGGTYPISVSSNGQVNILWNPQ
jgi:hypothetical protein